MRIILIAWSKFPPSFDPGWGKKLTNANVLAPAHPQLLNLQDDELISFWKWSIFYSSL